MNRISKITDIRKGEGKRVAVMAAYGFLIITAYNVLKPMTRSLFVSNLGLEQFPFLYILLAIVVGIFVGFYLRVSASLKLNRLINLTTIFLMSNLLLFWWWLNTGTQSPLLYYSFFIWASIFGVLTPTQFWLLANLLFNAREAKRIFPVLSISAILGGIAGGYFTRFLVKQIGGTENLALFCIVLLSGTIALINLAWRYREQTDETRQARSPLESESGEFFKIIQEVFRLIRNSRHLASLVGIVGLTFIVVQIADFQFVAYGSQASSQTDDLTGFLGFWLSNMSIIALLFQLFFSSSIIRRFGVGATMLFLPLALGIGSLWVLVGYGLVSVLALKIGDGAFRHSINKVGFELLFLPIPSEVKKKTKAFVDMFVDRFARGMAGVLLLVFYSWLGWSVAEISILSLVLIAAWLALTVTANREYVNSFRQALAQRQIDTDLISVSISDQKTIETLISTLSSNNERQIIYALQLLESVEGVDLIPSLLPLLKNDSCEIRVRTLQLLTERGDEQLLSEVEPLLQDEDVDVRREAVRFYVRYSEESATALVSEWLDGEHTGLQGAALYHLFENEELCNQLLSHDLIKSFLTSGPDGRAAVADALGNLRDENYNRYLKDLMQDGDSLVKTRALKSAGKTGSFDFVPSLIENLKDREIRKVAREALAAYGEKIIEQLQEYIRKETVSESIRAEIPKIIAKIPGEKSVELLLQNLDMQNESIRYQVIKALNKLRVQMPEYKFDHRVDDALDAELKSYFKFLAILNVAESNVDSQRALLGRAIEERLEDHINRIFRLLGLRYQPRDIYNAYAATTSNNKAVRANAIEFLDNILPNNLKRLLLPIVEELPPQQVLQQVNGMVGSKFSTQREAFVAILKDGDTWLRTCALYEIGRTGQAREFQEFIEDAKHEENKLIHETAELVAKKFT